MQGPALASEAGGADRGSKVSLQHLVQEQALQVLREGDRAAQVPAADGLRTLEGAEADQ